MIPLQKVKDIITQHNNLESELSSGKIDPKLFECCSKNRQNLSLSKPPKIQIHLENFSLFQQF